MAGLFHYFHHFVKGYTVITVCKGRIDIGVKSSGCRIGISFDTRDLYQSAYRIASHSQVMLQAHFGCILYLGRLPPNNWLAAADAIEQATPTSAWQPASAPEMEALCFTIFPINPAVASALKIRISLKSRLFCK